MKLEERDIRFLMCTYVTFVFVYMVYMHMYTKLRNPLSFTDHRRSGNEAGFLSLYTQTVNICCWVYVIYVYVDMSHMCMYMYVTYIQIRVWHI